MLHSGSRNLGSVICDHHHGVALDLCKRWKIALPAEHLAFLPVDTDEGKAYIHDMNLALDFARENRARMMDEVKCKINDIFGHFKILSELDVHHNYARLENHLGRNVWVHRKGATSAKKDELGIIPGSQGHPSYIVRGLGNLMSFMSCSHGAGRLFGRNEASKRLDPEVEAKKMEGIIADSFGTVELKQDGEHRAFADLSEAPGAYKDIQVVMNNQKDLVGVEVELMPIANLKGKENAFRKKRK